MDGYDVRTIDGDKVGHVVGTKGGYIVVEHGTILKAKHAVPRELTNVEEADRIVRLTVSKDVFGDSPKVGDDFDERVIAEYYGVGEGYEAPVAEDALSENDPSASAEVQGRDYEVVSPVEERTAVRDSLGRED
jgi:hypothetical protein